MTNGQISDEAKAIIEGKLYECLAFRKKYEKNNSHTGL